jgi:hypothetical protein
VCEPLMASASLKAFAITSGQGADGAIRYALDTIRYLGCLRPAGSSRQ